MNKRQRDNAQGVSFSIQIMDGPPYRSLTSASKSYAWKQVIFAESAVRLGSILALWLSMMINDADRDRIRELCSLIAVEQDRHKLLQLIEELSLILAAKDERLKIKQLGS